MIDLHSHILPRLDDGPQDLSESLEMAIRYVKAGYSRVAATPHWVTGSVWQPSAQQVLKWVKGFHQALIKQDIDLLVVPGMEIAMTSGISSLLKSGELLALNNGGSVLVEPPFQQLPMGWEQIFFEIMAEGRQVILAHPERCAQLTKEPDILKEMMDMGVGIQINWKSVMGIYGQSTQEKAWWFLEKGMAHCLATDGHRPDDIRPIALVQARRGLSQRLGEDASRMLMIDNPQLIWNGEAPKRIPELKRTTTRKKGKRWFKWG